MQELESSIQEYKLEADFCEQNKPNNILQMDFTLKQKKKETETFTVYTGNSL